MKRLQPAWPSLERRLRSARQVICCLDFDGTLAPIAARPSSARLQARTRRVLSALAQLPGVSLIVISGRSLADVKRRVRLKGIVYVGNHGLELEGPALSHTHPVARRRRPILRQIAKRLIEALRPIPHAWVEEKGLTLSVHYRQVSPTDRPALRRRLRAALQPYVRKRQARLWPGNRVWEIRPDVPWHKGRAIQWLLRRLSAGRGSLVICVGDDRTDEDAFQAVNRLHGISIRVGRQRTPTAAAYRLGGPSEVAACLQQMHKRLVEVMSPCDGSCRCATPRRARRRAAVQRPRPCRAATGRLRAALRAPAPRLPSH